MLTSRHQTVNERRASTASRRAFLKFCRENKKRGVCHSLVPNTSSEIRSSGTSTAHAIFFFFSFFDRANSSRAASIFVWSQTFSSVAFSWQSPKREPETLLRVTTYASDARASPTTHPICQALYTYIPRDESTRRSRRFREALELVRKSPRRNFPREGSASPQAPAL